MASTFLLPNVELNMEGVTVAAVAIKPGDRVEVGQIVATVETQKATVDITAEEAGFVHEVFVKAGQEVGEKAPVYSYADTPAGSAAPSAAGAAPAGAAAPADAARSAPRAAEAPAAAGRRGWPDHRGRRGGEGAGRARGPPAGPRQRDPAGRRAPHRPQWPRHQP